MNRARLGTILVSFALATCGGQAAPLPQWTVVITTDAPVPQFGDRLLVEILDEDGKTLPGCSTCQRQLGASDAAIWPISFGVAADRPTVRVRARLFRVALLGPAGTPIGSALIDRSASLPRTSGDLRVTIELPMRCFGVPADIESKTTCDPNTGALAAETAAAEGASPLHAGTWPPAARVECTGDTPAEMVCVPGGAFLLGDPTAVGTTAFQSTTTPEHVVQVSPFRIDRDELTVQSFLDLRARHPELGEPDKNGARGSATEFCSYQGSDPKLPLNCMTRTLASGICSALGKRLPTEAEWEWAAGNRSSESAYPWGSDNDVCLYAVVARADLCTNCGPPLCRTTAKGTLPAGPAAGGEPHDVTALGVRNLGGNLSEWVADAFASYVDACWNGAVPLLDPKCTTPPTNAGMRGGNWQDVPLGARVVFRRSGSPNATSPLVGARCAQSM